MTNRIADARVLITGGTGSFGDRAIDRFLAAGAAQVTIYSRDEYKQSQVQRQYRGEPRVRLMLGDVRDEARLDEAMEGIDLVVHAAAMKQIDSCEAHPVEAVSTNVMGAHHVIRACRRHGVTRAVNLSADKASLASGVYGATKLLSERIFSQTNDPGGRFRAASVRYSNVLGSRGSVVEIFERQLKAGGSITVFDSRMIRFVLTQDQVVDLVLFALDRMLGGEVFLKDSPALRIVDLAYAMTELRGGTVEVRQGDARAGEKYDACMFSAVEAERTVLTPDGYFVILPEGIGPRREEYLSSYKGARAIPAENYDSTSARLLNQAEARDLVQAVTGAAGNTTA